MMPPDFIMPDPLAVPLESLDFTEGILYHETPYARRVVIGGMALADKVAEQTATSGAYRAALNLRKSGYSLEVALALVAHRMPA